MIGTPTQHKAVGRDWSKDSRKQKATCTFRMLPSTDKKWRWFTERSGCSPSAVANALVRDLVGDKLKFRHDSAVLKIILESGLAEHYEDQSDDGETRTSSFNEV